MRTRYNWSLTQTLYEPNKTEPYRTARLRGNGHKKRKHRIDEHSKAQKPQGSVPLGQNAKWDLRQNVAIKE